MGFCEYKSHSGGREFKSPLLHQKERVNSTGLPLFYSIRGSWRSHPPLPIIFKTAYHGSSYLTIEDVIPITCEGVLLDHLGNEELFKGNDLFGVKGGLPWKPPTLCDESFEDRLYIS